MKLLNKTLLASAVTLLAVSSISAETKSAQNNKSPWNGFFVGALMGGKFIGGKGSLTTKDVSGKKTYTGEDSILIPLPTYALNIGYNTEFSSNSTLTFATDLDYGVLPRIRVAYGYLVTEKDRLSVGVGIDALLFAAAFSGKKDLEISSLYGFTPTISYERSIGNGAFFQVRASYNYISLKAENLAADYSFPAPVKTFIKDYWNKDISDIDGVDASAHGVTVALGFGYTF